MGKKKTLVLLLSLSMKGLLQQYGCRLTNAYCCNNLVNTAFHPEIS